jgi:hypothetical protein
MKPATLWFDNYMAGLTIDPAQKIGIERTHPSDKNKGVARVGHPILCSYFRAGSITFVNSQHP